MSHPSNGIDSNISCFDWWIKNVRLDGVSVFVSNEHLTMEVNRKFIDFLTLYDYVNNIIYIYVD